MILAECLPSRLSRGARVVIVLLACAVLPLSVEGVQQEEKSAPPNSEPSSTGDSSAPANPSTEDEWRIKLRAVGEATGQANGGARFAVQLASGEDAAEWYEGNLSSEVGKASEAAERGRDLNVRYSLARLRAAELAYQAALTTAASQHVTNSDELIEQHRHELREAAQSLVDTLAGKAPIRFTSQQQLKYKEKETAVALIEYEKIRNLFQQSRAVTEHDVERARLQHEIQSLEVQILRRAQ